MNFLVPDTENPNLAGIPVLEELLKIDPVQNESNKRSVTLPTQNSENTKEKRQDKESSNSSSNSSLGLERPINFAPVAVPNRQRPIQEELVSAPGPSNRNTRDRRVRREILPVHPGASKDAITTDRNTEAEENKEIVEQNSDAICEPIETDVDTNDLVVKRIWAKKLITADKSHFKSDTRSIQNLKNAFNWVNKMVMKIDDKKNTFRTLLGDSLLFSTPCFNGDARLEKYRTHIRQDGATEQNLVVIYQAFVRNFFKTICKPDTYAWLSRNFERLGTDENARRNMGALIDAIIIESDPHLNGRTIPVTGNKIEHIVRTNLNRILENVEGHNAIQVNFRRSHLSYEFQLRNLLKFSQFSWSNAIAIDISDAKDFGQGIIEEVKEAQLLLRSLLNKDIVPPGKNDITLESL